MVHVYTIYVNPYSQIKPQYDDTETENKKRPTAKAVTL